jgi:hypothetical protein
MAPAFDRLAQMPWPIGRLSAVLLDQLRKQLDEIDSPEGAAIWARGILAAKNSLNAAEARQLEEAFQARLSELNDPSSDKEISSEAGPISRAVGDHRRRQVDRSHHLRRSALPAPHCHRLHPHIVLELRRVFLHRRFFRERPGEHELGLEHGLAALYPAIQRGRHPAQDRMTSIRICPVLVSYQRRLSSSVTTPSWTRRLPDKSFGSTSPRFSRQSRRSASSLSPIMIRASEPPMK